MALENFPSQNARDRRYSIYSIKDGGERPARGISELRGQESTPWTHRSFIYKQGLISQAGRRGFESRLRSKFSMTCTPQLQTVLRLCSVHITSRLFSNWLTISSLLSTGEWV